MFVANRVQRIRSSTEPSQWNYVTSENNPSDHVSRVLAAREFVESNWFMGPGFLWQRELPEEEKAKAGEIYEENPEFKRAQVYITETEGRSLSDHL